MVILTAIFKIIVEALAKFIWTEARKPNEAEEGRKPGKLEDELNDQLDEILGDRDE